MICTDKSKLVTTSQIVREFREALKSQTPKQAAELRIELRAFYKLPVQPEPESWRS